MTASGRLPADFSEGSPAHALLVEGIGQMQAGIDDATTSRLLMFLAEVWRWNQRINLTAIRDPMEMVRRHLLDSISLLPHIEAYDSGASSAIAVADSSGAKGGPDLGPNLGPNLKPDILDVGSGAGLPGIVIAMCRPDRQVLMIDSALRKVRFLTHAVAVAGLGNAHARHQRLEEHVPAQPGYAIVVTRAFRSPPELIRSCAHTLRPEGQCYVMCGEIDDEWDAQCSELGWASDRTALFVPGLRERNLVAMRRRS